MTKQEAIENHRKMWLWIAKKTLKDQFIYTKKDYFNLTDFDEDLPEKQCFCCSYAYNHTIGYSDCDKCPIDFGYSDCTHLGSLYLEWVNIVMDYGHRYLNNWKKAALLAYKISKLPEREGV